MYRRYVPHALTLLLIAACASCLSLTGGSPATANPFGGCVMCHVDVADEMKGDKHLVQGIGCVRCHGPSVAHSADENNEVKPDRVFTIANTDAQCRACHECSPQVTAQVRIRHKLCTECHGAHKLRERD